MIKKTFQVRFDELNAQGNIPTQTLLKYFQECAALDSQQLNFGFADMQQANTAWVLTHMQARALQADIAQQDVTVETWHAYSDKLLSRRQFIIYGQDGNKIMEGSSWWVIIDITRRRPVRTPQHLLDMNPAEREELEPEGNFKAALPCKTPTAALQIITREEDLDINTHVNNTHYAAWALESVPAEIKKGKRLEQILLSFKTECKEKETLRVEVYPESETSFWHVLVRESDGKEAARVYTRFA
ncbi:MAG: hypothetical protein E7027_06590 [Elusimicrobium sp.]|uniref:Acyl-ACP thioesterase n=1 Tax=Candidatus Avelusimicrobium gallicola TaxID=2562704 RepID=A0A928DQU3_9BACT|nr:hypothetical protein [Elusimicrobium sp.]